MPPVPVLFVFPRRGAIAVRQLLLATASRALVLEKHCVRGAAMVTHPSKTAHVKRNFKKIFADYGKGAASARRLFVCWLRSVGRSPLRQKKAAGKA